MQSKLPGLAIIHIRIIISTIGPGFPPQKKDESNIVIKIYTDKG